MPQGTGAVIDPAQKDVRVTRLLPAPDLTPMAPELFKPQAELSWAALAGAAAYRVQLASDPAFDKVVREYRVSATRASVADVPSASWYARVRGIDGQGLEGFDAVRLVAVRDAPPVVAPPAPSLWRAENASLRHVDGQTLLRWTPVTALGQPLQASGYTVELASDPYFGRKLQISLTTQTESVIGAIKGGVYFVRFRANLPDGRIVESEPYTFALPGDWGFTVFEVASALRQID